MRANLGYLFYKDIYKYTPISIKVDSRKVNQILDRRLEESDVVKVVDDSQNTFKLYTTYPGLLTGSGITHGVNNDNEDFKIGFYFDPTSGMPVIPGSGIKGTIRSTFPKLVTRDGQKTTKDAREKVKAGWLQAVLRGLNDKDFFTTTYAPVEDASQIDYELMAQMEAEIFDGRFNNKYVSIYQRDIFHDCVVSQPNSKDKILDLDYITSHENPLKNPNPLRFLKMSADVQLHFQFDLKNSQYESGGLSKEDKLKLFKYILLKTGLGAKTNVGYGQLSLKPIQERRRVTTQRQATTPENTIGNLSSYQRTGDYDGEVTELTDEYVEVKVGEDFFYKSISNVQRKVDRMIARAERRNIVLRFHELAIGQIVTFRVNRAFTSSTDQNYAIIPKKMDE